jgi:hypothetical protein
VHEYKHHCGWSPKREVYTNDNASNMPAQNNTLIDQWKLVMNGSRSGCPEGFHNADFLRVLGYNDLSDCHQVTRAAH